VVAGIIRTVGIFSGGVGGRSRRGNAKERGSDVQISVVGEAVAEDHEFSERNLAEQG
jgi:hypothetical protein